MPTPTTQSSIFSTSDAAAAPDSPPPPPLALRPPTKWGPYSSAKDFDANMATVLLVLVCATAIAFGLHAACSLLIRRLRRRRHLPSPLATDKPQAGAPPPLPGPVVFSSGATRMAGTPECAICLAELVEGDRVRVLPACSHGFHAQCVEMWLAGRSSCPTCRTDCLPPPAPVMPEP
ncbi:RING-H2 finger protein ATL74-like [Canna indica]|uniref:RING-H2 finger protein ATL74-like n=1 Tax=Canna indica TaxID=4628 RepID=A0AAQ3QF29_9LILI|nr:RING-H2 finger protein ATL74-like [Canna indica]